MVMMMSGYIDSLPMKHLNHERFTERKNQDILEFLKCNGQEEIFRFWEDLNTIERNLFLEQLRSIDWEECQKAFADIFTPIEASEPVTCPTDIFSSKDNEKKAKEYRQIGEEILSQGRVAALTVAGGQGTRLGHSGPKGTFLVAQLHKKRSLDNMQRVYSIFQKIQYHTMLVCDDKHF